MKKVLLFAVMALALGFVGCSSDDENFSSADIVGEWYVANESGYYYYDGQKYDYNESYSKTDTWIYWTFSSNGSFEAKNVEVPNNPDYFTGTWSISGNKLIMDIDGDKEINTIKTLTSAKLVVHTTGTDVDGKWEQTLSFVKSN